MSPEIATLSLALRWGAASMKQTLSMNLSLANKKHKVASHLYFSSNGRPKCLRAYINTGEWDGAGWKGPF